MGKNGFGAKKESSTAVCRTFFFAGVYITYGGKFRSAKRAFCFVAEKIRVWLVAKGRKVFWEIKKKKKGGGLSKMWARAEKWVGPTWPKMGDPLEGKNWWGAFVLGLGGPPLGEKRVALKKGR